MISHDKYQGTFCPSPMANFPLEATAFIDHTFLGPINHSPPLLLHSSYDAVQLQNARHYPIPIGAAQPEFTVFYIVSQSIPALSVLHRRDWRSSITSVVISTPVFHSALYIPIPMLLSLGRELLNSHWRFFLCVLGLMLDSALLTHPSRLRHSSTGETLLNIHQCPSSWTGCSSAWIGAPVIHSALLTRHHCGHSSSCLDGSQSPSALHSMDWPSSFHSALL
jgi:hypothetical protein